MNDNDLNRKITIKLFKGCWHEFQREEKRGLVSTRCKHCRMFKQDLNAKNKNRYFDQDRNDAFLIVDEMKRRGMFFELGNYTANGWRHYAHFQTQDHFVCEAEAETLPLAICKACEKYLESENGK